MQRLGNRRQVILFLLAILAPCIVLAVLSIRMLAQERELAGKRRTDQHQRELGEVASQLLQNLERTAAEGVRNPAVALVARIEDKRLVLPWDNNAAAPGALAQPHFVERIRQGEEREFAPAGLTRALESYEQALRIARNPAQAGYARLLHARTLDKLGRTAEAAGEFRGLLALPPGFTDEEGVPLALYAAERLCTADPEAARNAVSGTVEQGRFLPPAAWYLVSGLLDKLPRGQELKPAVSARIRDAAQAQALENDFPHLAGIGSAKPVWAVYGNPPWLVRTAPGPAITAVPAAAVLAPMESASLRFHEGEPLGETFPGLKARLAMPDDAASVTHLQSGLLYGALFVVMGATIFGAYLLWVDLRREVHVAEMRSQFVASVSHELKTPLTAIRMFAETLQMGRPADPETRAEYLDTIINESERLSRLVDDVLHFSRVEQGKKQYQFRPTRLADVIRAAARTLDYPLSQQGFRLHVRIEDGLGPLRADADALEQAILNLLSNAMKYSGDAREIELELVQQDGRAVIRITDHGIGIPASEQGRIFEKFYRAPTRENQLIPGTGLGLALVAHIAKVHGGGVEVRSAPGCGSTFSISLPMEAQKA